MTTITERERRRILGARITPASIDLTAADAFALARELAEVSNDPAVTQASLFAGMLSGEVKFMAVPVKVTDAVIECRPRPAIDSETVAALRREFGYVPDVEGGENWTVYQDHSLIVIHPARRPRIYRRGRGGTYYEIEPNFP